ncbi:MAG: bioA [Frankiales bacterium]|nr:bioA [Frankiales bacterium]
MADSATLLASDRAHVWHPYGAMPGQVEPLLVESAAGVRLRLADGRELVDGMSSWWAAIHGYRHPDLDAAAHGQLDRMSHVMFGGLTHAPAIELAEDLVRLTPEPLQHVFFSDSGSVSVEVAVKMALQFWIGRGRPGKHRLATWRGGYHGDTWQPMSVCDPDGGMHNLWTTHPGRLPAQLFADQPPAGFDAANRYLASRDAANREAPNGDASNGDGAVDASYLAHWDQLLGEHADELAAIIVEPVVQGAGGMTFHHPGYVTALRELADRHDVLLILDEIATGFGRTGTMFASEQAGISPDILCVGKALTGGYLSMAATLCTAAVADGVSASTSEAASGGGGLAHGPTFMANPLAASIARASIALLSDGGWQADVARIESELQTGLRPLGDRPGVKDVRVLGAIGVVQLDHPVDVPAATQAAVKQGAWLRPFRDLIYTMPPYPTDDADLAVLVRAISAAVDVA